MVSIGFTSQLHIDLCQKIIPSRLVEIVRSLTSGTCQIGQSFGILLLSDVEICHGQVAFALQALGKFHLADLSEGIFGIVHPVEAYLRTHQPQASFGCDKRFGGIEAGDVGKSGSGSKEVALLKLRFPHEQPRIFQKGVELLAREIGFELRRSVATGSDLWTFLDAV